MSTGQGKIFTAGSIIQDKWVILDFIGKGAMGEVYRAHQLNLQRDVAIKVASREWLESIEEDEEEIENALQRFRREVQAMAQVRHPNILQIFDYGSTTVKKGTDKYPVEYIVMEYIPGETLRHTMSEEGFYPEHDLTSAWLQDYFMPVLDGVRAIHALDMVHRDLKPENILMDGQIPKIADFGLARSSRLKPVTQSMDVKGTAHYMSPEHFFDFRKADHRADIYSLGKILYEAIDGKIDKENLPLKTVSLANAETPFFQKLDDIIRKATAEKKDERFDSVDKLHNALLNVIKGFPKEAAIEISVKPKYFSFLNKAKWIWTGVGLAILSVAAMTVWHLISEPGKEPIPQEMAQKAIKHLPQTKLDEPMTAAGTKPDGSKPTLLTEDGATLHLIPGGTVALPARSATKEKRAIKVDPFYMDEAPVTNHQYVEFLNRKDSQIEIAKSVVRSDDKIWLLLGAVKEGYEPIVFRDGEFKLTNAAYASFPVLRVTAYGASAYAKYYNRRLPSYPEWMYVQGKDFNNQKKSDTPYSSVEGKELEGMHSTMHGQKGNEFSFKNGVQKELYPVTNFAPNKYGIRGLNEGISEWGHWSLEEVPEHKGIESEFVVLPSGVIRQPWESFEKVGFRCVLSVRSAQK
jgi:serine/threonine-protein kinase